MPAPKNFVASIRAWELSSVSRFFPDTGRVLDFGAGTGDQSCLLAEMGYDVTALDVEGSDYSDATVYPVNFYDGKTIPFPDDSFDFIFSSNVLEHVRDIGGINAELRRVLRPGGSMIHVVPSASWRFWTSLTAFPDAPLLVVRTILDPRIGAEKLGIASKFYTKLWRAARRFASPFVFRRHGEWGNALTELRTFGRSAWRAYFVSQGYQILASGAVPLFYTGASLLGHRLTLEKRHVLSRKLGSACHVFVVKPLDSRA